MSKKKVGQTRKWRFLLVLLTPIFGCMVITFFLISYINANGSSAAKTVLPIPSQSTHIAGVSESDLIYDIQTDLYIMPFSLEATRDWFVQYIGLTEGDNSYVSNFKPYELTNEYLLFTAVGNMTRALPNGSAGPDGVPDCFTLRFGSIDSMLIHITQFHLTEDVRDSLQDRIIAVVSTCYGNW